MLHRDGRDSEPCQELGHDRCREDFCHGGHNRMTMEKPIWSFTILIILGSSWKTPDNRLITSISATD
jgi:hypothetical protein